MGRGSMNLLRFLRKLMGRRQEDRIKELVNEVGQELGMEEKQTPRESVGEKDQKRT